MTDTPDDELRARIERIGDTPLEERAAKLEEAEAALRSLLDDPTTPA